MQWCRVVGFQYREVMVEVVDVQTSVQVDEILRQCFIVDDVGVGCPVRIYCLTALDTLLILCSVISERWHPRKVGGFHDLSPVNERKLLHTVRIRTGYANSVGESNQKRITTAPCNDAFRLSVISITLAVSW